MSTIGTKRTSVLAPHMSALGGTADMTLCECLLLTQSGHRAIPFSFYLNRARYRSTTFIRVGPIPRMSRI